MIYDRVCTLYSGKYVISYFREVVFCFQSEDELIEVTSSQAATNVDDCSGCKVVINALDNKMQTMSRDELLNNMLQVGKWVCHLMKLASGCKNFFCICPH
jgi:hypothetical protein